MSGIVFSISQDIAASVGAPSFEDALKLPLDVALEIDGTARGSHITTFGDLEQIGNLLDYLRRYRGNPDATKPDDWVRKQLRRLLSADGLFETELSIALRDFPDISVTCDNALYRVVANIPWEMADGVAASEGNLLGTLAAMPVRRTVRGTNTALQVRPAGRLKVLYAIAEDAKGQSINAKEFHCEFKNILGDREGFVGTIPLIGTGSATADSWTYAPRFDQLLGQLENQPPNVLILVSHGRTTLGQSEVYFAAPDGKFKWHSLAEVGRILGQYKETFLVVVVACDLTWQADNTAANSGAMGLLAEGVPFVVAMQGKVLASLAGKFIATLIDRVLEHGDIAKAVAAGRMRMTLGSKKIDEFPDWSFPALFAAQDAVTVSGQLRDFIESFRPHLIRLLQAIPMVSPYFPRVRDGLDCSIQKFLHASANGVRFIGGPVGRGKSSSVRFACRAALEAAIGGRDTSFRKILYCDLNGSPLGSPRELIATIWKRNEDLRSQMSDGPPLKWARVRGADGAGQAAGDLAQLVSLIDLNAMILVLDNIAEEDHFPWGKCIEQLRQLTYSVVLVVSDHSLPTTWETHEAVNFSNLDKTETTQYAGLVAPGEKARSKDWYKMSGGILVLLNGLRFVKKDDLPSPQDLKSRDFSGALLKKTVGFLLKRTIPKSKDVCGFLSVLRHGLTRNLAEWLEVDTHALLELEDRGILTRDLRHENTTRWEMPSLIREGYGNAALRRNRQKLLAKFTDLIMRRGKHLEDLRLLSALPGGVELMLDLQGLMLEEHREPLALGLAAGLKEPLFQRGLWQPAYELWNNYLNAVDVEDTKASWWCECADAAHRLGLGARAEECLKIAESKRPGDYEKMRIADLKAALIKDRGSFDRESEVAACYRECYRLGNSLLRKRPRPKPDDVAHVEFKKALVQYNEAHFVRYWQNDIEKALKLVTDSEGGFRKLNDRTYEILARVAWCDFQIAWPEEPKNPKEMFSQLMEAEQFHSQPGHEVWADAAFTAYQIARYYRRWPSSAARSRTQRFQGAEAAYGRAEHFARKAGDLRQEMIAQAHRIELQWRELKEIDALGAVDVLEKVEEALRVFRGDRWSQRVRRDVLFWMATIVETSNLPRSCQWIAESLEVGTTPPLSPIRGTDARRAATAYLKGLRVLQSLGKTLELDSFIQRYHQFTSSWLGRETKGDAMNKLERGLREFLKQPEKHHG